MDDLINTSAELAEADAMPRARVVHTDPSACKTPEEMPLPKAVAARSVDQKSPAEWAYERLILYIKNFEEQLDSEHEVAMGFTGSNSGTMRIQGIGFFDPDVLTFYGVDESGLKTQLVQHVNQLNVMLRALPKAVEDAPAKRIGFRLAGDLGAE